jgi:hypothetical protein
MALGTPNQLRDDPRMNHVNQPVPDDGTLATQAYNYAVAHQGTSGNGLPTFKPEVQMTYQAQHDPNFQPPSGYKVLPDRSVIYDPGSWWDRYGGLLLAGGVLGVGAGAAIGAAVGGGAASGGAASGVPGLAISSTPFAGAVGNTAATAAIPSIGASSAAAGSAGMASQIGKYGQVANSLLQGRAAGRAAEGNANAQYDQNRLRAAQVFEDALRSRQSLAGQQAGNSVRGDILAGAQPLSVNGPIVHTGGRIPQISGGLSPALFSSNTRQLGSNMSRKALLDQMNTPELDIPQPQRPPQSNWMDKLLGGASIAGGLYGAYKGGF